METGVLVNHEAMTRSELFVPSISAFKFIRRTICLFCCVCYVTVKYVHSPLPGVVNDCVKSAGIVSVLLFETCADSLLS